MKKERIITLGNADSGKSTYMRLSLCYIVHNWKNLPMNGMSPNFIDDINRLENEMRDGHRLKKTQKRTELYFQAKLPILRWFPFLSSEHEFVVDDWPGEDFEALGGLDEQTINNSLMSKEEVAAQEGKSGDSRDKKEDAEKNEKTSRFFGAIRDASSYVIFLDGEKLKEREVERKVQKSLGNLQLLLQKLSQKGLPLKSLRFAFVVTKVDVLENLPEFAHESGDGLDIAKLQQHVASKYASFFNFLDWHKLRYRVFAVSCVPVKEHRRVDTEKGVMPASDWSMKDMESVLVHVDLRQEATRQRHDQLAPFRWLFRY